MRTMRLTAVLFSIALVACQSRDAAQEEGETVTENASSGDTAMEIEIERIQLEVGELTFEALAAGPETGDLVFMLHGFPQSSYEFRNQIPAVAGMGFRVVAPDQRGYSPGARPEGVDAYAVPNLVADVVGMADALGESDFTWWVTTGERSWRGMWGSRTQTA